MLQCIGNGVISKVSNASRPWLVPSGFPLFRAAQCTALAARAIAPAAANGSQAAQHACVCAVRRCGCGGGWMMWLGEQFAHLRDERTDSAKQHRQCFQKMQIPVETSFLQQATLKRKIVIRVGEEQHTARARHFPSARAGPNACCNALETASFRNASRPWLVPSGFPSFRAAEFTALAARAIAPAAATGS